ncbi:lactonase family protein [Kitasatospora sp. NPDC057015]|uniref:lactonase family protein n=1 Tax=Kitasatospora sp. NPDC057015 TaxID=3346001 RepID=UPI00363C2E75
MTTPADPLSIRRSPEPRTPGNLLLIGSYTSRTGQNPPEGGGLHLTRYDDSGHLTHEQVLSITSPSYSAFDAPHGIVHSTVEQEAGQVVSTGLDRRRGLHGPLTAASTGGSLPCHIAIHPRHTHVFATDYGSGTLAVFPTSTDGRITVTQPSQLFRHPGRSPREGLLEGPNAHMAAVSPDGRFVLCTDLGTDSLYTYRFDATTGTLTLHLTIHLPVGRGPRHLVFHPSARYIYLLNELSSSITICAFDPESGSVDPGLDLPVRHPHATGANYPAAIRLSLDARFVYTSNRGDDTIATHAITADGSRLQLLGTVPCGGTWPRDIALSPDGSLLFCANQRSDSVTVFHIDRGSGALKPAAAPFPITSPASVLPLPAE